MLTGKSDFETRKIENSFKCLTELTNFTCHIDNDILGYIKHHMTVHNSENRYEFLPQLYELFAAPVFHYFPVSIPNFMNAHTCSHVSSHRAESYFLPKMCIICKIVTFAQSRFLKMYTNPSTYMLFA